MKSKKRGQSGVEYILVVGFITFAIVSILALSVYYSGQIKDRINLNQIENFATQLTNSAESVFFSGEPSKTTIKLYLSEGVENIDINSDSLVFKVRTSSGINIREFKSKVPLQGNISVSEGMKEITLEAKETYVLISVNI